MILRETVAKFVYVVWAGMLITGVIYLIVELDGRTNETRRFAMRDDYVRVVSQASPVSISLFPSERVTATVFISARCPICQDSLKRIVSTLQEIPADEKLIVAIDSSHVAKAFWWENEHLLSGQQYTMFPHRQERSKLSIPVVPLFVVSDRRGMIRYSAHGVIADSAVAFLKSAAGVLLQEAEATGKIEEPVSS